MTFPDPARRSIAPADRSARCVAAARPRRRRSTKALIRQVALVVSLLVFAETLLLWAQFDPASADFQFVERACLDSRVRHQLRGRRRRHQPAAGRADRLPDAARAAQLVGVGAPARRARSACSCSLLESAMIGVFVSLDLFLFYVFWDAMLIPMYFLIGIWGYDRRIYAAVKFILYTMAGSVLMLARDLGLAFAAQHDDRRLQLRSAEAATTCRCPATCSSGSSWRSRWRSRSRCRCSRSTPGCPTRTSRRRRPAR